MQSKKKNKTHMSLLRIQDIFKLTSVFHHLPCVGTRQLCAQAHLRCIHKVCSTSLVIYILRQISSISPLSIAMKLGIQKIAMLLILNLFGTLKIEIRTFIHLFHPKSKLNRNKWFIVRPIIFLAFQCGQIVCKNVVLHFWSTTDYSPYKNDKKSAQIFHVLSEWIIKFQCINQTFEFCKDQQIKGLSI